MGSGCMKSDSIKVAFQIDGVKIQKIMNDGTASSILENLEYGTIPH